jgi:hypothetical protein
MFESEAMQIKLDQIVAGKNLLSLFIVLSAVMNTY